jgi:hypothetical protein
MTEKPVACPKARQMKARHAAGVREFGQRERPVEISLDRPKNPLGEHFSELCSLASASAQRIYGDSALAA